VSWFTFAGDTCLTDCGTWQVGDVNGDGKADLLHLTNNNPGSVVTWLSKGDGTYQVSGFTAASDTCLTHCGVWVAGDVNGDGKTDLMHITNNNPGNVITWLSNGDGTYQVSWFTFAGDTCLTDCGTWQVGDVNGDGKADLMHITSNNPGNVIAWRSSVQDPDRLVVLSSGTGSTVKPIYSSLPRILGARYFKEIASTYPRVAITPPLQVVTDVDVSDGVGGTRRTSYSYGTAIAEVGTGRGFLGFNWVQSQDVSTDLVTRSVFRQDFPYTGLVDQVWQGTGTSSAAELKNLGQSTNTYTCTDFVSASGCVIGAGKRYFVSSNQTDQKRWDLNGTTLPITRTTQSFDPYGNATAVTVSTLNADGSASGYSKSTVSTYANDTTNWILGRLLKSTVTSTTP
jgi:hypothetical protein